MKAHLLGAGIDSKLQKFAETLLLDLSSLGQEEVCQPEAQGEVLVLKGAVYQLVGTAYEQLLPSHVVHKFKLVHHPEQLGHQPPDSANADVKLNYKL